MPPIVYVVLILITATVFIGTVVYIVHNFRQSKYRRFVLQNSVCLKQLNEINSRYKFYPYLSFDQSYTYDNAIYYDSISCRDYLIYQLQENQNNILNQIKKVNINKQHYSKYVNEVQSITQFGEFQADIGKLRLNKLIKMEHALVEKNTLYRPTTEFILKVTLKRSNLNGQKLYNVKSEEFTSEDIIVLIKRLNNKKGSFYNDREIWDALCRVERGKVSNKLRFKIYERDGHRCCICGISDVQGAWLEIDHIIPIAKGGKSTFDNLQTLCHDCNVEKSDNIY